MESVKPDGVKITIYTNGFVFTAKKATQEVGTIFKFGPAEGKDLGSIMVSAKTIKNMKELNGLCVNSSIKMIAEPGKPMKMVCHIGCYGLLRIYFQNDSSK